MASVPNYVYIRMCMCSYIIAYSLYPTGEVIRIDIARGNVKTQLIANSQLLLAMLV